jgi:hypothetical protein
MVEIVHDASHGGRPGAPQARQPRTRRAPCYPAQVTYVRITDAGRRALAE